MFHQCVCAETERLTYIIQGKIKREREGNGSPCGQQWVCVCVCLLGGSLVARLQGAAVVVYVRWGTRFSFFAENKKVLFTTCCKEGARRWNINKETARQNKKLKRNMNSLSACFHLAFLLLAVRPSTRLSEISINRWIFGTLKHPSNTRHT